MARETGVESNQKLKILYLTPPCLTFTIIWYVSRVKWSNLEKGVSPSPTPRYNGYWKGRPRVALNYSRQLYFYSTPTLAGYLVTNLVIYIYIYIWFVSKWFRGNIIFKWDKVHLFVHCYMVSSIANTNNSSWFQVEMPFTGKEKTF